MDLLKRRLEKMIILLNLRRIFVVVVGREDEVEGITLDFDGGPEVAAFAGKGVGEPVGVGGCDGVEAKVFNVKGNHFQTPESSRLGQGRKIREDEVVTKGFVAGDPFVVIKEVATAIEN